MTSPTNTHGWPSALIQRLASLKKTRYHYTNFLANFLIMTFAATELILCSILFVAMLSLDP